MHGTEPPPIAAAIVGAQKAGTTSLLRYLAQHPEISGQATVETGFFVDDAEWLTGWPTAYARYFYDATTERLLAKSAAIYVNPDSFERLATHNPDCLLIFLLRDPVDRAFSGYRMERAKSGWINEPFDHILAALDDSSHPWHRAFLHMGEYAIALRHAYDFFPPAQVQVLMYEHLTEAPAEICRQVFRSLEVDDSFAPDTSVAHNVHREPSSRAAARTWRSLRSANGPVKSLAKRILSPRAFDRLADVSADLVYRTDRKEDMSLAVRERLNEYYRPRNMELAALIGCDLSHWSGMTS